MKIELKSSCVYALILQHIAQVWTLLDLFCLFKTREKQVFREKWQELTVDTFQGERAGKQHFPHYSAF